MPPRKKAQKPAHEMTTDELAKRVFPPKVLDELKRVANNEPVPKTKRSK